MSTFNRDYAMQVLFDENKTLKKRIAELEAELYAESKRKHEALLAQETFTKRIAKLESFVSALLIRQALEGE